jgi:hypothetical protein
VLSFCGAGRSAAMCTTEDPDERRTTEHPKQLRTSESILSQAAEFEKTLQTRQELKFRRVNPKREAGSEQRLPNLRIRRAKGALIEWSTDSIS